MRDLHEGQRRHPYGPRDLLSGSAFHLLGTARMGDDPVSSVCDRFGQTYDADTVFVADGSLFVTGGPCDPTSTISALALCQSRHLVRIAKPRAVTV